jgi:hypothetical protein
MSSRERNKIYVGDWGVTGRQVDSLAAIYGAIAKAMWDPQHLLTLWAYTACYSDSFTSSFRPTKILASFFFFISEMNFSLYKNR